MHNHNLPTYEAPEELNWPETLRITISSPEEAADCAIAAERDEQPSAEISFASANKLRRLLTDRRFEIIRSLMDDPAESIAALAERLERNYSVVHEDIEVLADYGIVQFRSDTRDRAPFVPYRSVEVDVMIQGTRSNDTEATA